MVVTLPMHDPKLNEVTQCAVLLVCFICLL